MMRVYIEWVALALLLTIPTGLGFRIFNILIFFIDISVLGINTVYRIIFIFILICIFNCTVYFDALLSKMFD